MWSREGTRVMRWETQDTPWGDEWPCRRFLLGGSIQVFFLFWEFCSCAYRGFSEMGTIQRDSRGLRTGCHDLSSS